MGKGIRVHGEDDGESCRKGTVGNGVRVDCDDDGEKDAGGGLWGSGYG